MQAMISINGAQREDNHEKSLGCSRLDGNTFQIAESKMEPRCHSVANMPPWLNRWDDSLLCLQLNQIHEFGVLSY